MAHFLLGLVIAAAGPAAPLADDLSAVKDGDVRKAVADYAKANPTAKPVTAVDAVGELVDAAKAKAGDGVKFQYDAAAKAAKFEWEYAAKKKADEADRPKVEAALRGLLAAAIEDRKGDLKLEGQALKDAVAAAGKATVKPAAAADAGGVPGVAGAVAGELDLAKFDTAQLQAALKAHLKAKPDAVEALRDLVYLDPVLAAEKATVDVTADPPTFGWQFPPKKATLDDAEKEKVAKALREALTAALAIEKDKAKKLRPADLDKAVAAAKKAAVEPLPYSKVYDLTGETFQQWVSAYLEKNPTAGDGIYPRTNPQSNLAGLGYNPPARKLTWLYSLDSGRSPTAQEQLDIAAALTDLLKKAADGAAGYPDADKAEVAKIVDAGTYSPVTKDGIRNIKDVTQEKVREMVLRHLDGRAVQEKLRGLGVVYGTDADRGLLVDGLTYSGPDPVTFRWVYPLVDPTQKLTDDNKRDIQAGLREVLADAVRTGGRNVELRPTPGLYDAELKGPIADAAAVPKQEFTTKDLTPAIVRGLVEAKLLVSGPELAALNRLVATGTLSSDVVLKFDPKELKFDLSGIPLAEDKDKLTADELAEVVKQVKALLKRAFAQAPPAQLLVKGELEKVYAAVDAAKVGVKDKVESKALRDQIDATKKLRADQLAQAKRLDDLEDQVAELRRLVEQLGQGRPTGPRFEVRYVEQRVGLFGCKRTTVPVVVQVP